MRGLSLRRQATCVRLVNHRQYRIEVFDELRGGWRLLIHAPGGASPPEVLRNHVPNGLTELLAEARHRIDRRAQDDATPDDMT